MAHLTQRQENFCLGIIEGLSQSDAYRAAYNTGKSSAKSVHELASRLMADVKVASRLAELRAPVIKEARLTLSEHLAELASLRDAAKESEQYSSAVTAEVSRGKASGLYVDKVDLTSKGQSIATLVTAALTGDFE